MAATAKQYELLFQLSARLGPNFSQSFKNASKVMSNLQTDLKDAKSKLNDVSAYQKQQNAVAKSKEKVSELQAEHERLKEEIRATGQATPELTKKLQENERAIQKARDATAREEEKLGELSETLKKAGINTENLDQNTEDLQRQYDKLAQAQEKVQKISEKQANNKQAISQTKTQLVGLVGTVAAIGTAIYAGPVKNAMEWQQQMQNVATLLDGDVKGRIAELNKDVLKLSNSTGIGTADLTDGLYQVISAFGDSADSAKQLEIASKAAKAGNATTTDSINLLSAVTKGYGDTSAVAQQKAADLAFQTVKLGQTSFPELASSMGAVIPLASTLGTKQEDLFGAMATLTGVTGGTAEVTTQLKATMQNFLSPSTAMQKSLEAMGYKSGKALLESEGLQGALEKLKGSVGGDELAFAKLFTSVEAQNAVLALAGTQADNFTEKTKQMYEATGAAEKAYITATDSPMAKLERAKTNISNLGKVLGGMLIPYVGQTAAKVADLTSKFTEFAQKNPQTIALIAKVVAGLVGLKAGGLIAKLGFLQVKGGILSVQKAFTLIKGLGITKYLSGLGGGFGGILTKMLPIVGVVAAIGGAIYYVSTHLEQVRGYIQKTFGDEGLAVFDKLWGIITEVGTAIKNAFFSSGAGVLDTFREVLPTIINTLQSGLLPLLPMIANLFMEILPLIGQLVTALLPVLGQLISAVITVLASLIAEILPVVVQLISAILPLVLQIIQNVLPVFIQLVNTIVPILIQIIQAVLPVIIQLIQTLLPIVMQIINTVLPVFIQLLNTLVPIFTNIIQAILPVLSALLQALIPVIQIVAQVFASVLGSALQSIANIVTNVMQIFQGLIDFITGVFTGNWSQAWEGVKSIFSGIFGGLGEIFKAPIKVVVSAINTVIRGLNKLKVPDWVPGLGGKGINIPEIPGFAKGTNKTPSTFIAGENGPELITNAANRKVFTATQTGQIFNNMAKAQDLNTANNVSANIGKAGTITLQVTNSPQVIVQNGDTSGIKEQLAQYDEEFLEKIREIIRTILKEQKEQEGRVAYA